MLREYQQKIKLKPFVPIFKETTLKKWDSSNSILTNISLLSVSRTTLNNSDTEEEERNDEEDFISHSRLSVSDPDHIVTSTAINSRQSISLKRPVVDTYLLQRHLNQIPKENAHYEQQQDFSELFHDLSSGFFNLEDDSSYNPRAIKSPPFSEHIKYLKRPVNSRPISKRSARIPVRTTKAEELKKSQKLANKQDETSDSLLKNFVRPREVKSGNSTVRTKDSSFQRPFTSSGRMTVRSVKSSNCLRPSTLHGTVQTNQPQFIHPFDNSQFSSPVEDMRPYTTARSKNLSEFENNSYHTALGYKNNNLNISRSLLHFMKEDISSNRVPAYSKPLNSSLLKEQNYPQTTKRYKMWRVKQWINDIIMKDYLEENKQASIESTMGTDPANAVYIDPSDDNLLADQIKKSPSANRTVEEASRLIPLLNTEIKRKMKRHNLLLTRIELDLYVF